MREHNIYVQQYDTENLRERFPDWDSMSKKEKNRAVRTLDPDDECMVHNAACVGQSEYVTRLTDPEDDLSAADVEYHLAVGNDDSVAPATSNRSLNNEVARVDVTDSVNQTSELLLSTFIDSKEANGYDLVEVGIVVVLPDGSEKLLNHSTIGTINKTSGRTATTDVFLEYTAI